jgi:hypothetical protein
MREMDSRQIVGGTADEEEKKKFEKMQAKLKREHREKEKLLEANR